MSEDVRRTDSGIELEPVYEPDPAFDPSSALGEPGRVPVHAGTVRVDVPLAAVDDAAVRRDGHAPTTRTAGSGTCLEHGQTGLSTAFDLPTQMGYDSDHPRAEGEVGRTGVAIDSVEDMHRLFAEIPLDRVSTSMTINATAPILLLLYELVAEERGIDASGPAGDRPERPAEGVRGARDLHLPAEALDAADHRLFAYCGERIPNWNTISISGYHMREAGATAAQEIAFTLANGIAYVQAAIDAGLAVDDFAPRLSFFFACHMHFFEEVAKFRAARRLWARIMVERFGASDPRSQALRFHTQTGGATLTAQQPENNIVRTALEALSAVLRRHAVAAHELVRRGAGAADRAQREDRAADPAGDRRTRRAWRTWPTRSGVRTTWRR